MTNPAQKKVLNLFFLCFVSLILLRTTSLFTAVERLSHYDELDIGVLAKSWLEGIRLPWWFFQMDPYSGEGVILGFSAIPFVKLLGPTLLAIKLPSLIFTLALFALTFYFLIRFFSLEIAGVFALLFVYAPSSFVQFSLAGLSGHGEALVGSLLILFFLYRYLYAGERALSLFAFGLSAGFGFWFYHENLMMVLTGLVSILVLRPKTFTRWKGLALFVGMGIGLIPWFYYNAVSQLQDFIFLRNQIQFLREPWFYGTIFKRAVDLFLQDIPASYAFNPVMGVPARLYSYFYAALLWIPLLPWWLQKMKEIVMSRSDEFRVLPFVLFPIIFCPVLLMSSFSIDRSLGFIGYRYLAPLQFMGFCSAAVAYKPSKKILMAVLILMGALGQTTLLFQEPFGSAQKFKGYSYYEAGAQWHSLLGPFLNKEEEARAFFQKFGTEEKFYLLWGMSAAGILNGDTHLFSKTDLGFEKARSWTVPASKIYFDEWSAGVSGKILEKSNLNFENLDEALIKEIRQLSPEAQEQAFREIGKKHFTLSHNSNIVFDSSLLAFMSKLKTEERQPLFWGLGWTVRKIFREDALRARQWIETFPYEAKAAAFNGFDQFEKWYQIPLEGSPS